MKHLKPYFFLLFLFLSTPFFITSCTDKNIKKDQKNAVSMGGVFHKIKKGESLWAISMAYKVPLDDIIEINDLNPSKTLYPDDEIFIPNVKKSIHKPIISQNSHSKDVHNKKQAYKYRTFTPKTKKKPKKRKPKAKGKHALASSYLNSMHWPTNGVVITEFGKNGRYKSDGMDIAAPLGSKIHAVMKGQVVYSGSQPSYGNIMIIKHPNNIITIYAHNHKNLVPKGKQVKKGEIIGEVGNSGNAQRYQLHFEIRNGVHPINPSPYLKRD